MKATSDSARRARPLLGTLVEIRARGAHADAAIERAFRDVERVHRAMSTQESTSDIARLRAGRWAGLDPWTRRVLERAHEIRVATDGLFEPACCDYSLDGIAKGFAVDRAIERLLEAGMDSGVVNAGGDLRVFGEGFESLHVRTADDPDRLVFVGEIRDLAVATSASVGVVDPRGGRCRTQGATVMAADCVTADALTKPCMLEPERAQEFAQRLGARVLFQ
jgi:thiamine biosynthesis lipoprotein